MRRDDYILALTSGLLTVDQSGFDHAIKYFNQFFELHEPAKPGAVSIAGSNAQFQPIPYIEWLKSMRSEGVENIQFYYHFEQTHAGMPAHMEAAFAGSQSLQMQVTTQKAYSTWRLRTLLSPQYEMTVVQFFSLINAQPKSEILWSRVSEQVNDSNRLNGRPEIEAGQIQDFLKGEGRDVYNFLVPQLITEIQVELEVLEEAFVIPEEFQTLLYKSDFGSLFGPADDRTPVFLYPTGPVTKDELLQLVNAQPFASEVWEELERSLTEYTPANIPATGYPSALDALDAAAVQELSHTICRAIATRCEQHNAQPVIPENLLHCIGPDELDGKRARARSKLSGGKQYYLQSNQQPWELYLFAPVEAAKVSTSETAADVKKHFISTLKQIAALATKMETPFAEAFLSAEFLLGDKIPSGDFSEEHENQIADIMQQKGFSDQALDIFKRNFSYARDQRLLGWTNEQIMSICAISMADVFGGMGSWNDMNPGDDALEYDRLSSDLFQSMKQYFAIVLGFGQ